MPEELKPDLRVPLGELMKGDNPKLEFPNGSRIVTVGDQCTITLVRQGFRPNIAIVDYKTKRKAIGNSAEMEGFDLILSLRNPAGRITKESWEILRTGFAADKCIRIDVEGEEDLLALPTIALAPEDTNVIYGMPSQGLVIVKVDNQIKQEVIGILNRMVVEGGD
jgi:uncharacterized protein (UPF0218 family)